MSSSIDKGSSDRQSDKHFVAADGNQSCKVSKHHIIHLLHHRGAESQPGRRPGINCHLSVTHLYFSPVSVPVPNKSTRNGNKWTEDSGNFTITPPASLNSTFSSRINISRQGSVGGHIALHLRRIKPVVFVKLAS